MLRPGVIELNVITFDEVVLRSRKPAFVDFYAPFCKYCKELDPIYEQLAIRYQHQNITIAKVDSYGQKTIGERYQVEGWPTLKFFDGTGGPPVDFKWMRGLETMSEFIDDQMSKLALAPMSFPPISMSSKPNLAELMKSKPCV
ncbi:thioredoxin-like protein [Lojkania enalia]|uniref:Thioredoxin-like protein n=1 Tax=Lojkania enalia TaxID=147567 RepID=A0A9P4K2D3_9PLEO|nr:thioredoxin-like protein [Didymosphaeria enalia]